MKPKKKPLRHLFRLVITKKNIILLSLGLILGIQAAGFEALTFQFLFLAIADISSEEKTSTFMNGFFHFLGVQPTFAVLMFFVALSQVLRSIGVFIAAYLFSYLSTNIQGMVQKKMLKRLFSFSFSYISNIKVGKISDILALPSNSLWPVLINFNMLISAVIFSVALLFFMLYLSPILTGITLSFFFLIGIGYRFGNQRITMRSEKYSKNVCSLNAEAVESVNAMRFIHYSNNSDTILEKLTGLLSTSLKSLRSVSIWATCVAYSFEIITISQVGLLLLFGKYFFSTELLAIPILVAFIGACYRFAQRAQAIVQALTTMMTYWGHLKRIDEFLIDDGKEFIPKGGNALDKIHSIKFCDVSLKYPQKDNDSISQLNIDIPIGKTIGIVGHSGAGKSSLLDLLLRLYEPTTGKIFVNGVDYIKYSLTSWRSHFGVVNQDTFLFHDTIEANLRLGKKDATMEEIRAACMLAGADKFIMKYPEKYQTIIGEKGFRLSGGERQRLAIARALIRKPKILILDEATNSLDSQTENIIQECFLNLQGKITVIIVAHRLSTVSHADAIYVLEQGRIIESGNHDALIQGDSKYKSLWNLQLSLK